MVEYAKCSRCDTTGYIRLEHIMSTLPLIHYYHCTGCGKKTSGDPDIDTAKALWNSANGQAKLNARHEVMKKSMPKDYWEQSTVLAKVQCEPDCQCKEPWNFGHDTSCAWKVWKNERT